MLFQTNNFYILKHDPAKFKNKTNIFIYNIYIYLLSIKIKYNIQNHTIKYKTLIMLGVDIKMILSSGPEPGSSPTIILSTEQNPSQK